jgi:hypothetical protein
MMIDPIEIHPILLGIPEQHIARTPSFSFKHEDKTISVVVKSMMIKFVRYSTKNYNDETDEIKDLIHQQIRFYFNQYLEDKLKHQHLDPNCNMMYWFVYKAYEHEEKITDMHGIEQKVYPDSGEPIPEGTHKFWYIIRFAFKCI